MVSGQFFMLSAEFKAISQPAVHCNGSWSVWLLPDAGDELSMLISGEYVGQDRRQPIHSLLGCVLLQHGEEFLFHFRLITQNLVDLTEIKQRCERSRVLLGQVSKNAGRCRHLVGLQCKIVTLHLQFERENSLVLGCIT